jgi:hypothetical protein
MLWFKGIFKLCRMTFLLGIIAAVASCSPIEPDPELTLDLALKTIDKQNSFAFSGTEEVQVDGITVQQRGAVRGAVAEQNRMYVQSESDEGTVYKRKEEAWIPAASQLTSVTGLFGNWNPLEKLEQLRALDKQVRINREMSLVNSLALDAEINSEEVTEWVKTSVRNRLESLTSDRLDSFIHTEHLNEAEASQLREELAKSTKANATKLMAMSDTLSVRMNYRMWIEPESSLMQRMTVEMLLSYHYDNQDHHEAIFADYEFRDFDKKVIIPQT